MSPNGAMGNEGCLCRFGNLMNDLCSRSGILSTILKWNLVNYTTVYHFYNITNSPLDYYSLDSEYNLAKTLLWSINAP
jgi:hypothetical protein